MNSDQSEDGIMDADVPVKGMKVLYPKIGDLLGWISLALIAVLIGLSFFRKYPKKIVRI